MHKRSSTTLSTEAIIALFIPLQSAFDVYLSAGVFCTACNGNIQKRQNLVVLHTYDLFDEHANALIISAQSTFAGGLHSFHQTLQSLCCPFRIKRH